MMISRSRQPNSTQNVRKQLRTDFLETLDQLIEKYPDIEIGWGDGEYVVNKQKQIRKQSINRPNYTKDYKRKLLPKRSAKPSVPRTNRQGRATRARSLKTVTAPSSSTKSITTIAKPGTAGSKQQLKAPRSRFGSKLPNGHVEEQNAPSQDFIDTNLMVDDTIISFINEMGQRAHPEEIPSDPEKFCKKFTILIPDLDSTEFLQTKRID